MLKTLIYSNNDYIVITIYSIIKYIFTLNKIIDNLTSYSNTCQINQLILFTIEIFLIV